MRFVTYDKNEYIENFVPYQGMKDSDVMFLDKWAVEYYEGEVLGDAIVLNDSGIQYDTSHLNISGDTMYVMHNKKQPIIQHDFMSILIPKLL